MAPASIETGDISSWLVPVGGSGIDGHSSQSGL